MHRKCISARRLKQALGAPTVQANALSAVRTHIITADDLVAQAVRRRAELEAARGIDWVSDRQPYPTGRTSLLFQELACVCFIGFQIEFHVPS